ncbi:MAG: nucleotide exchange factor GrpE [Desulfobacula sp. RIFOXYA12_FULL_46_16]|nr:MAG: nucleotide exchange factor GrpE [Deltaproteobacteria bacterium RIFOXYC2_FULL_48_10]OGR20881.1 MAG: nucleotide exchange factor GrpE [Desulfobacula sp. RIFOXYA12_FULL_46_16]OGR33969.1 MAG: nucleotide exchange factor GrpE [Desulfobacula sp. RIFOXYB2_FULL_45_6]
MAKEDKKKKEDRKIKDSPKKSSEELKAGEKADIDMADKAEKSEIDEVGTLKEQLAAEKDRLLRLSAEFENYKKRKQREIDEFKKFANETIFRQILPVVDNLERAIASAETNSGEGTNLLEGVKLTHKDILKLLEMFSVRVIKAGNEPFDPNFHQAVTRQETDEFPENTVTAVLQNGYLLHDRLIRPAMVVVSKKIENGKTTEN